MLGGADQYRHTSDYFDYDAHQEMTRSVKGCSMRLEGIVGMLLVGFQAR
jgi:hypothetical protein